jgi:lipopolysaccharide transport system ATP-binding protein
VRFHHTVDLEVRPGAYTLCLYVASCESQAYWALQNGDLDDEAFHTKAQRHCWAELTGEAGIEVTASAVSRWGGLVGLQGNVESELISEGPFARLNRFFRPPSKSKHDPTPPTIIHVTHWKAGSQWIRRILESAAGERIVEPSWDVSQFLARPIEPGKIYPTIYVTREQYERVDLPSNVRPFVVIRDLRDTLVSSYFSARYSHTLGNPYLVAWRGQLEEMDKDEGLHFLLDKWMSLCADIQVSWLEAGVPIIRYEDLLDHDIDVLVPLLIEECALEIARKPLVRIIEACRFEQITGGRTRGTEEIEAHERKGVAGDWRNHFSDATKQAFKARYGGLLVATGYETDLNW